MSRVYEALEELPASIQVWPLAGSAVEDAIFACAAVMFVEPTRSERARKALVHAIGPRRFEFFSGCLAFIRLAHYWTMLHPEIETEEEMTRLLQGQQELAQLLLLDPEACRSEMGERLFEELTELRALHERRELRKAKEALEEKDRQKDEFIAVLAHELRNPLAAIRASADAMNLLKLTDSRAKPLLERLGRQTTAMARMLDDLMDTSRLALEKVSVQIESIDFRELLQEILDEHEPRVRQSGLHLMTQLAADPCLIDGDRVRLRQVMDNLLINANKFTPEGGTIELVLAVITAHAVVTVRDTGVGFDADFARRLFEPFTQQERRRDRPGVGLGLGLAIASRLAQLHGGSLSAASDGVGKGATFTLSIPVAAQPAA
jgi:signal transduction histidine kinase